MFLFDLLKPKITVATHDGSFHADDVFAVATLSIWAEKEGKSIKVVRTRDAKIIDSADIVLDVGNTYDPLKNRFDHHQAGGAGTHENSIPYAAFGLIWKHFGNKITSKEIADIVENKLVIPIDAADNGVALFEKNKFEINDYLIDDAMSAMRATAPEKEIDNSFMRAVEFTKEILKGEIWKAKWKIEGKKFTEEMIAIQKEPSILVLEKYVDWNTAAEEHKSTKFVIYPDRNKKDWCIQAVQDNPREFDSVRVRFPESWRGLRDDELEKVSGIKGGIFCHRGGWFAVAKSKEASLALAKKAVEVGQK